MPFRTIQKSSDTGGLDRERVREAVIRLRDRTLCRDLHLDPGRLLFAELRTLVQEWADQNA